MITDLRNYNLEVGMIGTFVSNEHWCEGTSDSKIGKIQIVEIIPTEIDGSVGVIKNQLIVAKLLEPFTRTKNGITGVIEVGEKIYLGPKAFIHNENV